MAERRSLESFGFCHWERVAQGGNRMKLSTDRILTTHAGSMPRGEPLGSMLIDQEEGKRIDRRKIDEVAGERVAYIVRKEVEAGIDIANDGEQGRVGFRPTCRNAGAASAASRVVRRPGSSPSFRNSPSG